jgi:hypothetical protein
MKGDIAFAGFVLTAAEWQELDPEARAQLIAVATRRADPWLAAPIDGRLAEGSGPLDTEDVLELDPDLEPAELVEPPGDYIDLFDGPE